MGCPAKWYTPHRPADPLRKLFRGAGRPSASDPDEVTRLQPSGPGRSLRRWNIQKAIEGAKSAEVLAQAQTEFQEILDKTEK